ncbi:Uncharacterised protein [uncultured archaeon]|nr:Uncharacterised protein [uncultured archaeon]
MCLEDCFACQEPCWPRDELPVASPAAGYPCHSEPLSKQVFERSDDAQPAGRKLQDIPIYERPWYVVGD